MNEAESDVKNQMRPWMKYGILGIIIFYIWLILTSLMYTLPHPMAPFSEIAVNDLEGIDNNNDGKIDSITILITNYGTLAENIIAVELSNMNKSWKLLDLEYPVVVESLTIRKNLTLVPVTNQDQIAVEDDILINIYLESEGVANPAITISKDDLERHDSYFTLKEKVSYSKSHQDPSFEEIWRHIIFGLVVSFSPLAIYLIFLSLGIIPHKSKEENENE